MWSLFKSLLCVVVLFGVLGELSCFAAANDDDCCATVECALCAQSVTCMEPAPLFYRAARSGPVMMAAVSQPLAPDLTPPTPPPQARV